MSIKKTLKILGDKFSFYKPIASNILEPNSKINIISKDNIQTLVDSFKSSDKPFFVYNKHKSDPSEERLPIGKILDIRALEDEIGLEADIDFDDVAEDIIKSNSFYPSIEMEGIMRDSGEDEIFWDNLGVLGLAMVERGASDTELLTLSAVINCSDTNNINTNNKGENNMTLEEVIKKYEETGEVDDLIEVVKGNDELLKQIISKGLEGYKQQDNQNSEPDKSEPTNDNPPANEPTNDTANNDENKKDEDENKEVTLSKVDWERICKAYAQEQGAVEVALSCIDKTYTLANKMYKGGMKEDEIVELVKDKFTLVGSINTETPKKINLSAQEQEEQEYTELGKLIKNME